MKNYLIFFSERYPGEYIGGRYEEKEILELHKHFKKVIVTHAVGNNNTASDYNIPANVKNFFFNANISYISKLCSLKLVFSKLFLEEFKYIKNDLKLKVSLKLLIIFFVEMQKAIKLKNFIKTIIAAEDMDPPSILVYSFWNDYRAIAAALLKREFNQLKSISRTHAGDIFLERHPFNYLPAKKFIFHTLDGIYPISEITKNYILKRYCYYHAKVQVFRLGTSNHYYLKEYTNSDLLRIVSCSSIIKIKRIELLAEGLQLIKSVNFEWIHFGRDKMNNKIDSFCMEHFHEPKQKYHLFGMVENSEIMEYYNNHQVDLFMNTSISEGISVSIMEAMSFGIPVMATAVGGTPEIVKDGYNGYLLSANPSPQEIEFYVKKFHKLTFEEKKIMRQNAYSTWYNNYKAETNYKKFAEFIFTL